MRKNTTQLFEDIKKHLKQAKNKIKNYEKSDSNASCNTIQMIIPLPEEESSL